jgi:two-component system, chemotaxis family, response regulator Rcp1
MPSKKSSRKGAKSSKGEKPVKTRTRSRSTRSSPAGDAPATGKPIEILLVEDNDYDAQRTLKALKNGRVRNRVNWVEDGVEAMGYLRREGKYTASPRPDLILLDWYMPRMRGLEVLNEIKQDPDLKRIPVVIMTTSDEQKDLMDAYNGHANCYVTKPVDVNEFINKVRSLEDFWLTIVKLPPAA